MISNNANGSFSADVKATFVCLMGKQYELASIRPRLWNQVRFRTESEVDV